MSLVLGLKQGDDFWVGDKQVVVTRIEDARRFWVKVEDNDKEFEVTDTYATEIMDNVFVSAGNYYKYGLIRIAIEAPRDIKILRGDRYREEYLGVS